MPRKNKYDTIQIPSGVKEPLLEYCRENGFTLSGLVSKLIRNHLSESLQETKELLHD